MKKSKPALKATLYHNTQCSKSNAALALLEENGVEVVIIDYLETPLSSGQLEIVLSQLYLEARALIRFGEPVAKELGLSASDIRDEADWISFMAQHPILIERPIIQIGNKAIIGRPPEAVLALIENA